MMTPTVHNLKFLAHTVPPEELEELWNAAVSFLDLQQIDTNWALYHWLKEINKRYFYAYGSALEENHDGGFTPKDTPVSVGGEFFILLESGDFLLQESGDKIFLQ